MSNGDVKIAITGDPRDLNAAYREAQRGGSALARALGASFRGVGRGLAAIGTGAGRALSAGVRGAGGRALGSILGVISAGVGDVRDFERGIARLAIAQGKSNASMGGFRKNLTEISKEFGIDRNEVLAGASAYQALTGDTEGATKATRLFAKVATATGGSVEEAATLAAALSQNMKIKPDELESAFDIINTQGKAGAIELKDLAGELSSLTPQFGKFAGGEGVGGMAKLGAAVQIVRRNFGSASEAATGMRSLMTAIVRNSSKLGTKNVFWTDKNGKKHLRDFDQIIANIGNSKLMKDPAKLTKALGSVEAQNALTALLSNYKDWKALENTDNAKGSISKDAAQFLDSDAGKLDKALNELKLSIAQAFSPELIKGFAEAVGTVTGVINDAVGGVKSFAKGVAELAGGSPDEETRVLRMRGARLEERYKQLGVGEGSAQVGYGSIESQKRKALSIMAGEDAAEKYFKDIRKGKRKASSEFELGAYAGMLGATDQTSGADFSAEMILSQQQLRQDPKAVARRGHARKRFERYAGDQGDKFLGEGTGFGVKDVYEDFAAGGGTQQELARAIANALKGLQVNIAVDGNTIATANANSSDTRRSPAP